MKKGEIYEGVIEKIDFQNKGRVKIKDTTVTVKNGIPGQKVRFMINKKRGGRVEGRLLEVLEKSELEKRDPLCSIFSVMRRLYVSDYALRRAAENERRADQKTV